MTREPSSKDVQQDVQEARQRVDRTLSEIEEHFSPGQLFERTMDYMRQNSEGIGQFGRNMGRTLRDHPVPVLLVGAGLAALAVSAMRGSRHGDYYERGGYYMRDDWGDSAGAPWRESEWGASDEYSASEFARGDDESSYLYASDLDDSESSRSYAGQQQNRGSAVREQASAAMEKARHARQRAGEKVRSAGREMRYGYQRAGRAMHDTYEQQPLIYGALAALAGFGLAAMLPPTRREDELMGSYRDDIRDQAAGVVQQASQAAKETLSSEDSTGTNTGSNTSGATAEDWMRQQGDIRGSEGSPLNPTR